MNTIRSVAIVSLLFYAFLSLGMTGPSAGGRMSARQSETGNPGAVADFVHDKETVRLYLLYHNPAHGAISAMPSAEARNLTVSI